MIAKKQWIQAATVRTEDGALAITAAPPSTFAGGSKVPAEAGVAEPLVDTPTPCRFVWVGVPLMAELPEPPSTTWAANSCPVLLGDQHNQNLPLTPHTFRGVVIHICDASLIYVRSFAQGDGVEYRISGAGAP